MISQFYSLFLGCTWWWPLTALIPITLYLSTCILWPIYHRAIIEDAADCIALIGGSDRNLHGHTSTMTSLLATRANSNKRLTQVFGINNSFTTKDLNRHKAFVREAKSRIRLKPADWQNLASKAEILVHDAINLQADSLGQADNGNHRVALEALIQGVTLKLVLEILFPINALKIDDTDALVIAQEINRLWVFSKKNTWLKWLHKMQQGTDYTAVLKQHVLRILPDASFLPAENPLNLILPAYETMWRAVLLGFLEVRFRQPHSVQASVWKKGLCGYLSDTSVHPKKATADSDCEISAHDVVMETLRLYPPVKRISRASNLGLFGTTKLISADIEAIQRDSEVWGCDANRFNPSRWKSRSETGESQDSKDCHRLMAFGAAPFSCPAESDFVPRLISILMAVLCKIVPDDWSVYSAGEPLLFDSGDPLPTGRQAFEDWSIGKQEVA